MIYVHFITTDPPLLLSTPAEFAFFVPDDRTYDRDPILTDSSEIKYVDEVSHQYPHIYAATHPTFYSISPAWLMVGMGMVFTHYRQPD